MPTRLKPSQSLAGTWCDGGGIRMGEATHKAGEQAPLKRCPSCNRRLRLKIVACCEGSRPDPDGCGHYEVPRHKRK